MYFFCFRRITFTFDETHVQKATLLNDKLVRCSCFLAVPSDAFAKCKERISHQPECASTTTDCGSIYKFGINVSTVKQENETVYKTVAAELHNYVLREHNINTIPTICRRIQSHKSEPSVGKKKKKLVFQLNVSLHQSIIESEN